LSYVFHHGINDSVGESQGAFVKNLDLAYPAGPEHATLRCAMIDVYYLHHHVKDSSDFALPGKVLARSMTGLRRFESQILVDSRNRRLPINSSSGL
jgi:hypothetical protein